MPTYEVVVVQTLFRNCWTQLALQVNARLAQGWICVGGPVVLPGADGSVLGVAQAMLKPDVPPEETRHE
jgi:hypothetical protein